MNLAPPVGVVDLFHQLVWRIWPHQLVWWIYQSSLQELGNGKFVDEPRTSSSEVHSASPGTDVLLLVMDLFLPSHEHVCSSNISSPMYPGVMFLPKVKSDESYFFVEKSETVAFHFSLVPGCNLTVVEQSVQHEGLSYFVTRVVISSCSKTHFVRFKTHPCSHILQNGKNKRYEE